MTGDTYLSGTAMSYNDNPEYFTCDVGERYVSPKRELSYWSNWLFYVLCGAVVNWTYSRRFDEWRLGILYWKSEMPKNLYYKRAVRFLKRLLYASGFCSRERGRHWHNKSKLQRQ